MTKTAGWSAAPLAVLGLVLAGCGGSSSHSAAPAGSTTRTAPNSSGAAPMSSAPAPGFASTSAGTPKGTLSKPDFLIRMNSLCSSLEARTKALPTPTAATDYAAITTNLTGLLTLRSSFLSRAEALIAETAERATLEKNWLAVAKADLAAFRPPAQRMLAHSKARNPAGVQADATVLSALPDHSSRLVTFLKGYGLSSCAELESR